MAQPPSKTVWKLPQDPAITSRSLPKRMKTCVHTRTRTHMFTATLFTRAERLEATQWPPADEWVNKCSVSPILDHRSPVHRSKAPTSSHTGTTRKHHGEEKKPITKYHAVEGSAHMRCRERARLQRQRGDRGRRGRGWGQEWGMTVNGQRGWFPFELLEIL